MEKARQTIEAFLTLMKEKNASDLFITVGFPPAIKLNGQIMPIQKNALNKEDVRFLLYSICSEKDLNHFERVKELNFALNLHSIGRFRVNLFVQQGNVGGVIRSINMNPPSLIDLNLPTDLEKTILEKRGILLVVGATGSGKSSTLGALLEIRNTKTASHIITLEDPIEFIYTSKKSIITQREVGMDTESWENALKNSLRQAPDVIMLGEIRDAETMEYALTFAETGHLCVATLHANNANQAIERIINFFPKEKHSQILMDLSFNLKAILSQRLIVGKRGGKRIPSIEVLLSTPLMKDLIFKNDLVNIKDLMKKSAPLGMVTFDQSLFNLFKDELITYEEALRNADAINDLRLRIKLELGVSNEDEAKSYSKEKIKKQLVQEQKIDSKNQDSQGKGLGLSLKED